MEYFDLNLIIQNASMHSQHVKEICAEFMQQYNLTCFQHIRWFKDNKKIDLCTHLPLIDWYYKEARYSFSLIEIPPHSFGDGHIFSDALPASSPIREQFQNVMNGFDIAHDFFLLENFSEFSDIYIFSSPLKDPHANCKYMRIYKNLKKFTSYYRKKVVRIINQYNPFKLSKDVKINHHYLNTIVDAYLVKVDEAKNYNNKIEITKLTQREIEVLHWLAKGKTSPEIAIILALSKRTIEEHIAKIKYKLGCVNLFQAGRIAGELQHHFRPLFNELEYCGESA